MLLSRNFDFFDAMESRIEQNTLLEIAQVNYEFENWLIENNLYAVQEADNSQQSHSQWKITTINNIKNDSIRFVQFAMQQVAKDSKFLQANRDVILNVKQYPPKKNLRLQNSPNYAAAIQRISTPLSSNLTGLDISKVDPSSKDSNSQIKSSILPGYDGKTDFAQYAKKYYYGADITRSDLTSQQCGQLLPIAFQFCFTYETRLKSMGTDVNGIISFINKEPDASKVQSATNSDMQKIQQQSSPQQGGMASTNPNTNIGVATPVNADTNFRYFMNDYFGYGNWESIKEEPIPMMDRKTVSGQKAPPTVNINITQPNNQQKLPGAPVDTKALAYKKKEIVCDIIKDAFNAKITVIGMIYSDFINLIRMHVANYRGSAAANQGRIESPQNNQQVPQQDQSQQQ